MPSSAAGRMLESRLFHIEGKAQAAFLEAFHHQTVIRSEAQFQTLVNEIGRTLTWQLWELAISELDTFAP